MNLSYWWWKILGVLLFTYVLTRGLLTPLKPGIEDVSPNRAQAGKSLSLNIIGYNTNYTKGKNTVYIKNIDSFYITSQAVQVIDDQRLNAQFSIPLFLPTKQSLSQFSIIVSSNFDGTSIIPSKLILHQDSINQEQAQLLWLSSKPNFTIINKYHFPYRNILYETIRNTFFHVSLWFAMFALLAASVFNSIQFLRKNDLNYDFKANAQVRTGILFGILGLLTGSLWAKYTWGSWWTNDIKLNMAALSMLIYMSYLIIRAGIEDLDKRARISASYNVFALVAIIPLIFILPRLMDSLHPGNGGNPAFGSEDMDNALRLVFYPAVISFILLGFWIADLVFRIQVLENKTEDPNNY
ncbi:MAG: cytochrome c biogenesis protein CcsA [Saprospiraceae bacterium]